MDNKTIENVFLKYLKLSEEINETFDQEYKSDLALQINEIKKILKDYIYKQIEIGNIDNEFINFVAKVNAFDVLSTDVDLVHDDATLFDNNNYNLSSESIKSYLTGKEIPLIGLSPLQKVELIYMHTGCIISSNDSVLTNNRDRAFESFWSNLNKYTSSFNLKMIYGDNWKEEVERIYKQAYDRTVCSYINNIVEKVDEKNRIRQEGLNKELEESEKEIEALTNEVKELKEEVAELTSTIGQLQTERKDELNKYKETIVAMIKNNSEDKRRFYQDGTTRPDMSYDEYDRYTTYRNREGETGMQERVNDAAHVHKSLSLEEYAMRQQELEQAYGVTAEQEDKPKSR